MSERFLVIGSNAFSGATFCQYLLNNGFEVMGISRSPELNPVFLPYQWQLQQSEEPPKKRTIDFHQVDLNHDLDALMTLINERRPKYIVNFAAQGMVAQSWLQPEHWYQTNVVAQVKLHDQLRQLDFIEKYVHVSTPEVYGSTDGQVAENFQFAPSTPYAVSRAACDLHLMSFYKAYQFPVVFTRAANVYGPGQQLYRIIPRALLYARLGKKLQLHGGGHSVRSFIYMEDVADATVKIALQGQVGESYHVSTLQTLSIRQLVAHICELAGVDFDDLVTASEERLGKDKFYSLDSTKLRKTLAWSDQTQLSQGIANTLAWIDSNLDQLKVLPQEYQHKP